MDDDRILALEIEDPDLKESAVRRGADDIANSPATCWRIAFRIACSMSSSEAPCLRAGSPILI
jgi:hypothetical protein